MDPDWTEESGNSNSPVSVPRVPEYSSQAMGEVLKQIRAVAGSESHVLLLGESGSGKDHVADLIHNFSGKMRRPFIMVNCPGMDKQVIQSELFGHEKGAFTGAEFVKKGLVELADGGTLFLNEIGELPLDLQSKLLTFLDTKRFYPLGGLNQILVKARVIAATNIAIEEEVSQGRFRSDLYYRLSVVTILVPPLRARMDDIPILVRELLTKLSQEMRLKEIPNMARHDVDKLADHTWPGNVRELKNVLEKGILFGHGNRVSMEWFDPIRKGSTTEPGQPIDGELPPNGAWSWQTSFPEQNLEEKVEAFRRAAAEEALRRTGGRKKPAARLLGIDRHTLDRISKSH